MLRNSANAKWLCICVLDKSDILKFARLLRVNLDDERFFVLKMMIIPPQHDGEPLINFANAADCEYHRSPF